MTFHTEPIQALIAEIDAVLGKNSKSPIGWLVGETAQERQVLERVRKYLQNLQSQAASAQIPPVISQELQQANSQVQPVQLQGELAALEQQRQALIQEIEQLEQKRQDYVSLAEAKALQEQVIAEFSQALMSRLQETVTQEAALTLSRIKETQLIKRESTFDTNEGSQTTEVEWPSEIIASIPEQNLEVDRLVQPQQKFTAEFGVPLPYAGIELRVEIIEDSERSQLVGQQTDAIAPSEESYLAKTLDKELSFEEAQEIEEGDILKIAPLNSSIEDVPYPAVAMRSDTITALTDLLEHTAISAAESVELGSPEDELLTKDRLKEKQNLDLWQSENVAEQLSEDLSSLEGLDRADVLEQADVLQTTDELKSSIDSDLAAAVEQERRNYPIPEDILAEFDDLFGDSTETIDEQNDSDTEYELTQQSASNSNPEEAEKKKIEAVEQPSPEDSTLANEQSYSQPFDPEQKQEVSQEAQEKVDIVPLPSLRLTASAPSRPVSLTASYTSSPTFIWYLGIDFGTTGISAALLNRSEGKLYPIAWSPSEQMDSTEPIYRLPAVASGETVQKNFKPYLKVGLPYFSPETSNWEPQLQWSKPQQNQMALSHPTSEGEVNKVALREVITAVQKLLANLKPKDRLAEGEIDTPELDGISEYSCFADGLSPETFTSALANLGGVIISCPANWPEAYRFNLQESVLATGLVNNPEKICFLEEAIATLVAELHLNFAVPGDSQLETGENSEPSVSNFPVIKNSKNIRQGATLVIHSGATTTELALVDIPKNLQDLTYSDFTLRSFPYAGSYIEQDIVCQLLLNPEIGASLIKDLELPLPGDPDLATRYKLQIRLESSPLGQTLLEAAHHLKVILQHQESFTLNIGKYEWQLQRQDLENRVYSRFIQYLNRELNTLLALQSMSVEAIGQVLCTGGTAMLESLSDWLRQKLPNAKIILESGESPQPSQSKIEKVALGLAALPLYPQVFDSSRQQYNDYFLLLELLRTFGDRPLSAGKIMNILERKGINTRACQQRLFALLEGNLPAGLVPSELEASLLTQESQQNPEYQALRVEKPFYKQEDQTYSLNSQYCDRLRSYLAMVLERTHQKLEDPYTVYWLAPASKANT